MLENLARFRSHARAAARGGRARATSSYGKFLDLGFRQR
jgi:hypothetical protein